MFYVDLFVGLTLLIKSIMNLWNNDRGIRDSIEYEFTEDAD